MDACLCAHNFAALLPVSLSLSLSPTIRTVRQNLWLQQMMETYINRWNSDIVPTGEGVKINYNSVEEAFFLGPNEN